MSKRFFVYACVMYFVHKYHIVLIFSIITKIQRTPRSLTCTTLAEILRPLLVDRGRITEQISLFFGARKHTQIGIFSVRAEMSSSIAAASGLSTTCLSSSSFYVAVFSMFYV